MSIFRYKGSFVLSLCSGVDNPGHPFIMTVGCVAGDEESYDVFSEFLDAVIDKRHGGYSKVLYICMYMYLYVQCTYMSVYYLISHCLV